MSWRSKWLLLLRWGKTVKDWSKANSVTPIHTHTYTDKTNQTTPTFTSSAAAHHRRRRWVLQNLWDNNTHHPTSLTSSQFLMFFCCCCWKSAFFFLFAGCRERRRWGRTRSWRGRSQERKPERKCGGIEGFGERGNGWWFSRTRNSSELPTTNCRWNANVKESKTECHKPIKACHQLQHQSCLSIHSSSFTPTPTPSSSSPFSFSFRPSLHTYSSSKSAQFMCQITWLVQCLCLAKCANQN